MVWDPRVDAPFQSATGFWIITWKFPGMAICCCQPRYSISLTQLMLASSTKATIEIVQVRVQLFSWHEIGRVVEVALICQCKLPTAAWQPKELAAPFRCALWLVLIREHSRVLAYNYI